MTSPRASELDDVTLARARRGEPAALTALVDCYSARIYALAGRMMAARPDMVDDLAQETLVKVIRGVGGFDPGGPARLSTWILTVATRTCIDALRRPRAVSVEDGWQGGIAAPCAAGDPERDAQQRELSRLVVSAMEQLRPEQRAVLVLRAFHDFDYDEIARALSTEVGTVKSRLHRARAALRGAVARWEEDR
jgi:RNA polymerase sigma-70 factor (ECF subfamily)